MSISDVRGRLCDQPGIEARVVAAEQEEERVTGVRSVEAQRRVDLPCRLVSVGATPTANFARVLTGITEVRAGVLMFVIR
jgi:D-serine deaminase-like pyridoxal phosphate-dependent protein